MLVKHAVKTFTKLDLRQTFAPIVASSDAPGDRILDENQWKDVEVNQ